MTSMTARLRAIPSWQVTLGAALLGLGFLIAAQLAAEGPRVRYTTQERSPLVETATQLQRRQDELKARILQLRAQIQSTEQAGEGSGPLKIMYRVDGSSDLDEETLDHWEGYAGSKPVRIGNGAADQLQLDIYGELLDSVWLADRHGIRVGHPGWTKLAQLTDWLCEHWDQPDEGVWETRGGRQNFTYGRLMCWVALDRMVRLAVGDLELAEVLERHEVPRLARIRPDVRLVAQPLQRRQGRDRDASRLLERHVGRLQCDSAIRGDA